jgi:hypothetical protein
VLSRQVLVRVHLSALLRSDAWLLGPSFNHSLPEYSFFPPPPFGLSNPSLFRPQSHSLPPLQLDQGRRVDRTPQTIFVCSHPWEKPSWPGLTLYTAYWRARTAHQLPLTSPERGPTTHALLPLGFVFLPRHYCANGVSPASPWGAASFLPRESLLHVRLRKHCSVLRLRQHRSTAAAPVSPASASAALGVPQALLSAAAPPAWAGTVLSPIPAGRVSLSA